MPGIGSLQELIGLGGIPNAARSYVRGAAIDYLTRAGHSANSILSQLSAAGLGVRRQQGLQMISTVRQRQASQLTAGNIPLSSSLRGNIAGEVPANWTGQYFHQVTMTWRGKDEEGNYVLHERTIGFNSADVLTGQEAISAAFDRVNEAPPPGEESHYPMAASDILAMSLSGVWYDTQGRMRSV